MNQYNKRYTHEKNQKNIKIRKKTGYDKLRLFPGVIIKQLQLTVPILVR